jgi:2-C-methyl-D-erythritol 4-phosphate cytidylyltransferase
MMKAALIIPAAGRGTRFGAETKKPYVELGGRAIFLRTLDRFAGMAEFACRIVVVSAEDLDFVRTTFGAELARLGVDKILAGGQERYDSVSAGLAAVPEECGLVAIHDAVRPFVPVAAVREALEVAERIGAACVALPLVETVKRATSAGIIEATVPREGLWGAQTPQVFRTELIRLAYERRGKFAGALTDDAQLVEALGHPVALVAGSRENIKITTPEDLRLAEAILAR